MALFLSYNATPLRLLRFLLRPATVCATVQKTTKSVALEGATDAVALQCNGQVQQVQRNL